MDQLQQVAATHSVTDVLTRQYFLVQVKICKKLGCPVCRSQIRGEELVVSKSIEKLIEMYFL